MRLHRCVKKLTAEFPPPGTCDSVEALLAAPGALGNNDLLQVGQLRQIAGDTAELGFGALFARTVDGRGGEGVALHTLTGHLKEKQTQAIITRTAQLPLGELHWGSVVSLCNNCSE